MKFVISTQELNFLLNKCLNVIPQKTTIPILSNILIEAANNELVLTATDLMVGIRCYTEAKVVEEGATTLPAKRFAQLIRELTSINVEITANANDVTEIIADTSKFKMHGMRKNEFPSLPIMSGAIEIKLSQSNLSDMMFRTAFAVSRDDNRYALTGMLMRIENQEMIFVGTDGKRLARNRMPINVGSNVTANYIIPLKAVEEILKNLTGEGEVKLYLLPDKIAVETTHSMTVTKLLSGDYPDVNRVIPENSQTFVTLHREELMTLLRQISLFIADAHHSVRFAFSDGELKLSANAKEVGEGKVSMPVNYRGQTLEVAFNPNFFLDILRHIKAETVILGMTDSYNPGVITDPDLSSASNLARFLHLV